MSRIPQDKTSRIHRTLYRFWQRLCFVAVLAAVVTGSHSRHTSVTTAQPLEETHDSSSWFSESSFLFDRRSQVNICILSWNQYGGYEGPNCDPNAPVEWGCNCGNSEYDCQNLLEAVTCLGNRRYGKCVLRTDGKPMCAKPLDGEDCFPCRVDADCPTDGVFNRCVYIGEPWQSECADTPTLVCGTRVCMQFHDL